MVNEEEKCSSDICHLSVQAQNHTLTYTEFCRPPSSTSSSILCFTFHASSFSLPNSTTCCRVADVDRVYCTTATWQHLLNCRFRKINFANLHKHKHKHILNSIISLLGLWSNFDTRMWVKRRDEGM